MKYSAKRISVFSELQSFLDSLEDGNFVTMTSVYNNLVGGPVYTIVYREKI